MVEDKTQFLKVISLSPPAAVSELIYIEVQLKINVIYCLGRNVKKKSTSLKKTTEIELSNFTTKIIKQRNIDKNFEDLIIEKGCVGQCEL